MEELILNKLKKELNFRERILLRLNKKLLIKIYSIASVNTTNIFLKYS